MCGIAGFRGFKDRPLLERMGASLAHRGPDGQGWYEDDQVSLAHTRLKIIDLSPAAAQPLYNEAHTLVLVYNGEIYNYRALRAELEAQGHRFSSQTDSEVIVHLFEAEGEAGFARLEGMFAFALWDQLKEYLYLVRDPLGIKPLCYKILPEGIIFASELKALLQAPQVSRELDPAALEEYLTFRYCKAPHTLVAGVQRLLPGHYLKVEAHTRQLKPYWAWDFTPEVPARSEADYRDELKTLLLQSVDKHLVSEVPVGLHLSGGLDSSALLALMSRFRSQVPCFTLGFGSEYDEVAYAARLARHFGAQQTVYQLGEQDLADFPAAVAALDEPIGDAIILPTYLLYRLSSGKITVALTGEGGDELFGGYIHALALPWKERLARFLPPGAARLLTGLPPALLNKVFPYPAALGTSGPKRLEEFLRAKTRAEAYLSWAALFDSAERTRLYHPEWAAYREDDFTRTFNRVPEADPLVQVLAYDLEYWLPDYTLLKQDRLSMALSQEGRFPFLDRNLVQWALKLPPQFKIKGLTQKYLLRKALQDLLPVWARRRPKQAFYFPVDNWLAGKFGGSVREVLAHLAERKIFRAEFMDSLWPELPRDGLLKSKQIMALYLLELWLEKHF